MSRRRLRHGKISDYLINKQIILLKIFYFILLQGIDNASQHSLLLGNLGVLLGDDLVAHKNFCVTMFDDREIYRLM